MKSKYIFFFIILYISHTMVFEFGRMWVECRWKKKDFFCHFRHSFSFVCVQLLWLNESASSWRKFYKNSAKFSFTKTRKAPKSKTKKIIKKCSAKVLCSFDDLKRKIRRKRKKKFPIQIVDVRQYVLGPNQYRRTGSNNNIFAGCM